MHLGIAERAFRGVGPAGLPVKLMHDAISSRAYGAIAAGASGLGKAVDVAMERRGVGEQVSLSTTQKGSFGLAVLNGLIGDQLERDGSALAQPTSARMHGQRIGLDESSLRDAFPQATGRLAVFIHGLTGDEFCWSWGTGGRVWRPARLGPRLHAGLPALQQRPAHLRERPLGGGAAGRSSWRRGRSRCTRSRWSATPWAVWWRAAPPTRQTSTSMDGSGRSGISSRWGPPTTVPPWSRGRTGLRRHSTSCPRRGC